MCDDVCKCVILGYRNKTDLTFTGIRRKGQHLGEMQSEVNISPGKKKGLAAKKS